MLSRIQTGFFVPPFTWKEVEFMNVATFNQTNPLSYIKALHRTTDGYITLFRKLDDGQVMQRHFKLDQLNDDVLRDWVTYDSYMSLNSFYRPVRGNAHLRQLSNLYVDLDCYNVNLTPEQVLAALESDYFNRSIPLPNIVLYSGRGLGLIWHIEPTSGLALERWGIVQRAIFEKLKEFGADPSITTDGARIFRLPASVNSKSNEVVRYDVLHNHEYDIKSIGADYFGIIAKKPREKAQKRTRTSKKRTSIKYGFNGFTLAQARLKDFETLIQMREGEMRGHRERLLFLARFYAQRITNNDDAAIQKIEYLNGLFVMPLKQSELVKATQSAVSYVKDGTGINISNATLIEWFGITAAEQEQLTTIISKKEKRERDRVAKEKARRSAGIQTKAQYNVKRAKAVLRHVKRLKLIVAMYPTASLRELAERFGMSKTYVADLLKRINDIIVNNIEQVSTHGSSLVMGASVFGVLSTGTRLDMAITATDLLRLAQLLRRLLLEST